MGNNDEPTLAVMSQKPLKGIPKEMIDEQEKSQPIFEEIQRTGEFNDGMAELLDGFLKYIAKDVLHQNKRLGGRMAVAHAVFSRKQRDSMRKILGPECVFIVLNMSRECQKKRVL